MERTATQCRDCNKRYIGCHARCQSYKDYRATMDRTSKIKQDNAEFKMYLTDAIKRMEG